MQVKQFQSLTSASPLRIGVLGGSFNPPHSGHVHLALHALKALNLDYVVWLVALGNPFKEGSDMASYAVRYALTQRMVGHHPRMMVTNIEQRIKKNYTRDVLVHLQRFMPQHHFIWLMGADGAAGLMRWQKAQQMMHHVPIAIFDRAPATHGALRSCFALRYPSQRVAQPRHLGRSGTPAWSYVFMPRHPMSATYLRKTLGTDAFV
ncbi:MAG: nicotinate-nicotinamide nucleotide adenylyltransferase [Alphaproteobacteria bacterium]|nr:MAG: nicotinate-nicotinamide nucleotide adenylyltransferase [Alphaproteobacteria bacterium]